MEDCRGPGRGGGQRAESNDRGQQTSLTVEFPPRSPKPLGTTTMPKTTRPTPEETQRGYPFAVGGFVNVLRENDIRGLDTIRQKYAQT